MEFMSRNIGHKDFDDWRTIVDSKREVHIEIIRNLHKLYVRTNCSTTGCSDPINYIILYIYLLLRLKTITVPPNLSINLVANFLDSRSAICNGYKGKKSVVLQTELLCLNWNHIFWIQVCIGDKKD